MVKGGIEAELAELRGELAALKEKVGLLEAARNVSPQYGEAVALAQKGLAIVSGDADLLVLNPFEEIPILRPAEFLARL